MGRAEKTLVVAAFAFLMVYVPCFVALVELDAGYYPVFRGYVRLEWFFPFHLLGIIVGIAALLLTLRDVSVRQFPLWPKRLWLLAILFAPLFSGWIAYIIRHGFKPRPASESRGDRPPLMDCGIPAGDGGA